MTEAEEVQESKLRHLSRSVDYIENRIAKLNVDCRVFIAWQFVTIGFVSGANSHLEKNKALLDFTEFSEANFIYVLSAIFIFWNILNVLMYINCIRPVKPFPSETSLRELFGSIFAVDAVEMKNSNQTNLIWPLSDAPAGFPAYRASFSTKLSEWSAHKEEDELVSTLSVLHGIVSTKMGWYRAAVLSTRLQIFVLFVVCILVSLALLASSF